MKHLINMVEIQEGWVGVLTQWWFITPHPQRTAPTEENHNKFSSDQENPSNYV